MQARFNRWIAITILVLLASSAVGLVVKGTIRPRERDWSRNIYTTAPSASTVTRDDIFVGPLAFNSLRPFVNNSDWSMIEPISDAIMAYRIRNPHDLTMSFDTSRMAEEWVRFGIYAHRQKSPTTSLLEADARTIQQTLPEASKLFPQPLWNGTFEIVAWASAQKTSDHVALVRHTTTINGARATAYCRWWVSWSSSGGGWKVYDCELYPSRLRLGALIASMHTTVPTKANVVSDRSRSTQSTVQLHQALSRMMETGEVLPLNPQSDAANSRFVAPLEVFKQALVPGAGDPLNRLKDIANIWTDSPTLKLMMAHHKAQAETIAAYRQEAGDHPWADAFEARVIREQGDNLKAVSRLEESLQENAGHPLLLTVLFELLERRDRAELGSRAAMGMAPGPAIRLLFERHATDPAMPSIVAEYRKAQPNEPEGTLAAAVLASSAGRAPEAVALLKSITADAKEKKERLDRFVALHRKLTGNDGAAVTSQVK